MTWPAWTSFFTFMCDSLNELPSFSLFLALPFLCLGKLLSVEDQSFLLDRPRQTPEKETDEHLRPFHYYGKTPSPPSPLSKQTELTKWITKEWSPIDKQTAAKLTNIEIKSCWPIAWAVSCRENIDLDQVTRPAFSTKKGACNRGIWISITVNPRASLACIWYARALNSMDLGVSVRPGCEITEVFEKQKLRIKMPIRSPNGLSLSTKPDYGHNRCNIIQHVAQPDSLCMRKLPV